jgi:hypothetical protein
MHQGGVGRGLCQWTLTEAGARRYRGLHVCHDWRLRHDPAAATGGVRAARRAGDVRRGAPRAARRLAHRPGAAGQRARGDRCEGRRGPRGGVRRRLALSPACAAGRGRRVRAGARRCCGSRRGAGPTLRRIRRPRPWSWRWPTRVFAWSAGSRPASTRGLASPSTGSGISSTTRSRCTGSRSRRRTRRTAGRTGRSSSFGRLRRSLRWARLGGRSRSRSSCRERDRRSVALAVSRVKG